MMMRKPVWLAVLLMAIVLASGLDLAAQTAVTSSLRGSVTDPSGASVPGALVQLRGPGGERRATTDESGRYSLTGLQPGDYRVRFIAKGFTIDDRGKVTIRGGMTIDSQLTIKVEAQVVNVEEAASNVSADPSENGTALVLGQKELETLSDDPDELQEQLQALAGPASGPNGGQIMIDGFSNGNMPPKSSIREVRINSNPFSPEYDRPGFGRIEILTKPGSDQIRGQLFAQFNDESLNSRSPLLEQSKRTPYQQKMLGLNLSGPLIKGKASYGFDLERRSTDENAFIYATTLDSSLVPQTISQAVLTPQTRTNLSPRLDLALNPRNTLVARYQYGRNSYDNDGIGDYSLLSKAYRQTGSNHALQLTETAVLSAKTINEFRFQYMRAETSRTGDTSQPAITVAGAFEGGGAQVGNSGGLSNNWEFNDTMSHTMGRHMFKWGARLRQANYDDTSVNNFGGTYTFLGGTGPELDASNNAIVGTPVQLTALERYRRTLLFQSMGLSAATIRALGGGASQFSLSAGTATTSVNQFDAGLFWNDDWRMRPNFTLSYGLRYETQTNISDHGDWSPRLGLAWGIDGGASKSAKTVLRAGFGAFYDRIGESTVLQSLRYNGLTQQSYLILNPDFYPAIPAASTLAGSLQPQRYQILDASLVAPRIYQTSVGLDRQINKYFRLSGQYMIARGVHLSRTRNINTPIDGIYPFGDSNQRILTETTGFSRTNQLVISPHLSYKKLFLFGFYSYSHGKSDAEGTPADPYNLRAEWGPSSYADIRHRIVIGTHLPLPWKLTVGPFITASSGAPYDIATGIDTNGDGFASERPALVTGMDGAACASNGYTYKAGFGCFNTNPGAGASILGRNTARGPATFTVNMRLARTWSFGSKGDSGPSDAGGPPPGGGGMRGGGGPPPGGGMGGPPPGGGPGRGMFGGNSGKKYNLTLSISARNLFNTANYAAPSGDLSSTFFGEYRSLAGFGPFGGNTTYNRKIDLQLRFTF